MPRITLQFITLSALVAFKNNLTCPAYTITVKDLFLTCDCTVENIMDATANFGGVVVSKPLHAGYAV